jgi:hypothetical protein
MALSSAGFYFAMRYIMNRHDPVRNMYRRRKEELSKKLKTGNAESINQLQLRLKELRLTEHEEVIATEIIAGNDENILGFSRMFPL